MARATPAGLRSTAAPRTDSKMKSGSMSLKSLACLLIVCFGTASLCWSASKKKKGEEEITQTLEIPPDPPAAVVADASKLVFLQTPLSAKGLLSQQIRDSLKNLLGQLKGAQLVKIRAFVAGSGDLRRVPSLVSEIFSDKRISLPAVTVVQVGALPLIGAQVLLEGIAVDRRTANPQGLAFISGQPGPAKQAGPALITAVEKLNLQPESVRQVSCFLDSLDHEPEVRQQISSAFPKAPASYVQLRRDSAGDFTECEAVAALVNAPASNPTVSGPAGRYSQASSIGPVRVALTGTQMAFGREDKDTKLALERLGKALEGVGASWRSVVRTNTYTMTNAIRTKIGESRLALVNAQAPPASTMIMFESLPSLDASFAIEAVAVVER